MKGKQVGMCQGSKDTQEQQGHARDTKFHVLGIQRVHDLVLKAFQPRSMFRLGAWVEAVKEDHGVLAHGFLVLHVCFTHSHEGAQGVEGYAGK